MKTPVSVVIPAYNSSKLLPETIDSILGQSYAPEEIIVVDDGSTDATGDVVRRMSGRVRYHYKENGGPCAARNVGVALARSSFVAFCDSDDLWREDKLEQQVELHAKAPELAFSFTNFTIVSGGVRESATKLDGAPPGFFRGCKQVTSSGVICEESMYERILRFQPIWPSTMLISRGLFEALGGFVESFGRNPSEDLEFSLRCLQHEPTGIIKEPVVSVRKHESNFSRSNYRNALGQIDILRYALEHHSIPESTRKIIEDQLARRRVDASYAAFELMQFAVCKSLLAEVPGVYISSKVRLKQIISCMPFPLSRRLHSLLVRRAENGGR